MPYDLLDYNIKMFFDKRDNEYCVYIEEIPEVSAYGETIDKAIIELQIVYTEWLKICKKERYPIPVPLRLEDFSGKFVVRVPKSLHKSLSDRAKKENISLNQEIIYCITKGLKAS